MAERGFTIRTSGRELHVAGSMLLSSPRVSGPTIDLPDAQVLPGLINCHDHLHRNHYGRLGNPPYRDTYEWTRDIEANFRSRVAEGRRLDRFGALLVGAWKNLFAGVTTVVHHDPWVEEFSRGMPLRVVLPRQAHSLGLQPDLVPPLNGPFCLHLAEGTGPEMADEVRALERRGLLDQDLLAVHCVGLDKEGIALFRACGAALVWCPSSNAFLFGRTVEAALAEEGVDVLLGTDSLLTGVGDLLDELKHARERRLLSDGRLLDAVGAVAARRLSLPPPSLIAGSSADLVVFGSPPLESTAEDVELVVVDGVPRVVHPRFAPHFEALGWTGKLMTVAGVTRWTCHERLNRVRPCKAQRVQSRQTA